MSEIIYVGRKEIWKDVCEYEGHYKISNNGQILSCKNIKKIIKPWLSYGGRETPYLCVALSKNGIVKKHRINRLVAQAFIPNPENKKVVNHINANKIDNRVENLQWSTYSENNKHAWDNNLKCRAMYKARTLDLITAKLIKYSNLSVYQLSKKYKLNSGVVSQIKNKQTYQEV